MLFRSHLDLPAGFDFYKGLEDAVKSGVAELITVPEFEGKLPPTSISDDSKPHMDNWIDAMRNRNLKPNGHVMTGYWHSIGTIMATRSYREDKKMFYDRKNDQIVTERLKI